MANAISIKKLMDELKHEVHTSRFERLFSEKTKHLSGPQRLQLKLRLNEMAKPASNSVDLRRKVPGKVSPLEHLGRTHYFDAGAEKIFRDGLKANNGVFTENTRQQIMQHARELQKQRDINLDQGQKNSSLGSFVLGRYYRRSEERMNFVIDVTLTTDNDKSTKSKVLQAVTVDISIQGMQLKVPEEKNVAPLLHQNVNIHFIGLAREFVFDANKSYGYQVVGIHSKDGFNYLRLRRQATASDDALDKLLQGLLSGYKFRYKVNVDHVIHSVRAKGHESQWLQAQQGIPLVFSGEVQKPVYAITTQSNSKLLEPWCEQYPLLLNGLFNEHWVRLALARLRSEQPQTRLQLAFYYLRLRIKGEVRHYAVPTAALAKQPALKNIMAGLQSAGCTVQSMVLTVTYSQLDRLFIGQLTTLELPIWKSTKTAELKLGALREHQLSLQEVRSTKIVNEHPRLSQLYTKFGLCNALFVHRESATQYDIGLAALMPFKRGLPSRFQHPELWLNNSQNILGGARLQQQILDSLRQVKPSNSGSGGALLLRLSQSDNKKDPSVTGLWLKDFKSFDDASEYMKKLYKEKRLLAVNIELYRCKRPQIRALKDDLNYVKTYLPHRARKLEQQIRSIDSVIGVQDITAPLLRMALA